MALFKERVLKAISKFFSDSYLSSPPVSPRAESQAWPRTIGKNNQSSYITSIYPPVILDRSISYKYQHYIKRFPSRPVKQGPDSQLLNTDKQYLSACKNNETSNALDGKTHQEDKECAIRRSSRNSDVFAQQIDDQQSPKTPLTNLMDESVFVSPALYNFFQSCLPNIVKGRRWVLLYSTLKHGVSLRSLIRKSAESSGPCLLIAGDIEGATFGGMLECPLQSTTKRKYQGTNQTFVFTTIHGEPRIYRPTGIIEPTVLELPSSSNVEKIKTCRVQNIIEVGEKLKNYGQNRYYCLCMNDMLALGGGNSFALRLNEDLLTGTSEACSTFGNSGLAHKPEFELKNVELWGFMHESQYLTRKKHEKISFAHL